MLKAAGVVSKLLAVLLLLAPVAVASVFVAAGTSRPPIALVALAWVLVYAVVAIMAIVESTTLYRRGDADALGSSGRLVKYGSIPFFSAGFVFVLSLGGGLFVTSTLFGMGFVATAAAAVVVPVLAIVMFLIMLPTSAYGIAGAVLLRRQGRAGTSFVVVTVLMHLVLVLDVVGSLIVADRAKGGSASPARMVRWIAAAVVMALLIPTGVFLADTPRRLAEHQAQQQGHDTLAALPGVARIDGRRITLSPDVTAAQAQSVAVAAYPLQDSTSPSDADYWTLTLGSARFLLRGTDPAATQALVLLGRAALPDGVRLDVTSGRRVDSTGVLAFVTVGGVSADRGRGYTEAVATVVRVLSATDPRASAVIWSIHASRWAVVGPTLHDVATADRLDALGGLLTDNVALDDLTLGPTRSELTLTVRDAGQVDDLCRRGLTALQGTPGLELRVGVVGTASRDVPVC